MHVISQLPISNFHQQCVIAGDLLCGMLNVIISFSDHAILHY